MKTSWFAIVVVALLGASTCSAQSKSADAKTSKIEYAIVIHGGAGRAPRSDEWRTNQTKVLQQALDKGVRMLKDRATGLDTVETVIRVLEDSEYFNAGKGAVFNATGNHELDASIMDGRTRAGGAVGGVRTVRNPISLARLVMTETRHVLLVTDGAERFADEVKDNQQISRVSNEHFSTKYRREQLERVQAADKQKSRRDDTRMGTVGCVVLDRHGNLAAGTSTGGLTNKKFGRIGDSPILTAGTFADNDTCAVSCTGIGEDYIRGAVAFDVSARMAYRGDSLDAAVRSILTDSTHKVRGGIIAVSHDGRITMQFNTQGMARAAADSSGRNEVHVAK